LTESKSKWHKYTMQFLEKIFSKFSPTRFFLDISMILTEIPHISVTAEKFRHFPDGRHPVKLH